MMKYMIAAALAASMQLATVQASFAAGDGLDRGAAAQGNDTFAGQHRFSRNRNMVENQRMRQPKRRSQSSAGRRSSR